MTKKKINKQIKCDVESCRHQNSEEGMCELEEIKVSCNCEHDECESNDETVCESFENINETIYSDDEDIDIDDYED